MSLLIDGTHVHFFRYLFLNKVHYSSGDRIILTPEQIRDGQTVQYVAQTVNGNHKFIPNFWDEHLKKDRGIPPYVEVDVKDIHDYGSRRELKVDDLLRIPSDHPSCKGMPYKQLMAFRDEERRLRYLEFRKFPESMKRSGLDRDFYVIPISYTEVRNYLISEPFYEEPSIVIPIVQILEDDSQLVNRDSINQDINSVLPDIHSGRLGCESLLLVLRHQIQLAIVRRYLRYFYPSYHLLLCAPVHISVNQPTTVCIIPGLALQAAPFKHIRFKNRE